jgi:putative serine protease PepD
VTTPGAGDPWWARPQESGGGAPEPGADPYAVPGPSTQPLPPDTGPSLGSPHRGPHYVPAGLPDHWAAPLPADQLGAANPRPPRRSGAIVAAALVAALLGGGVGGVVGARIEHDSGGSTGSAAPAPTFTQGGNTPADTGSGSVASIAAKVLPSVVTIKVSGATESGTGSGVILTSTGYILTNNHVVEVAANGGTVQVVFYNSRRPYAASIVGRDPKTDLAVIRVKVAGDLPAATLGRSGSLVVGDPVVAIGAPLDLSSTVTSGIVSALGRNVSVPGDNGQNNTLIGAIQTDAAINPGNSGGALVDSKAQVIGINSAIATAPNGGSGSIGLGFAIPIDYARSIADEIIRTGKATHPYIGVSAQSVTSSSGAASSGALVSTVIPNGPADEAGLRAGDIIIKINNEPVDNVDDLIATTRLHKIGDVVTVTYVRDGATKSVSVRLQEAPAS